MRIYVSFDDTDTLDADRGTGKLVRWFEGELPAGCRLWGVVRQQLLVHPDIPYTSHNSSACAVVETDDPSVLDELIVRAQTHLERHALDGSDPGLCVVPEGSPSLPALEELGRRACGAVLTQRDALEAARGCHLSGHGGTNDGIIGAAAGAGLTARGWSGRLIEYRRSLRSFDPLALVAELEEAGIGVLSVDRNAMVPSPTDTVDTQGWLRPRLWGGVPALPVQPVGPGQWRSMGGKSKGHGAGEGD